MQILNHGGYWIRQYCFRQVLLYLFRICRETWPGHFFSVYLLPISCFLSFGLVLIRRILLFCIDESDDVDKPSVSICHPSSWNSWLLKNLKFKATLDGHNSGDDVHRVCMWELPNCSFYQVPFTHTQSSEAYEINKEEERAFSFPFTQVHFVLWAFDLNFSTFHSRTCLKQYYLIQ